MKTSNYIMPTRGSNPNHELTCVCNHCDGLRGLGDIFTDAVAQLQKTVDGLIKMVTNTASKASATHKVPLVAAVAAFRLANPGFAEKARVADFDFNGWVASQSPTKLTDLIVFSKEVATELARAASKKLAKMQAAKETAERQAGGGSVVPDVVANIVAKVPGGGVTVALGAAALGALLLVARRKRK